MTLGRKLTGRRCLCATCGEWFNTVALFDRHRVGKHDIAAPHFGRRCLTPEEMRAKGLRLSQSGFWIGPASSRVWPQVRRSDESRAQVAGTP